MTQAPEKFIIQERTLIFSEVDRKGVRTWHACVSVHVTAEAESLHNWHNWGTTILIAYRAEHLPGNSWKFFRSDVEMLAPEIKKAIAVVDFLKSSIEKHHHWAPCPFTRIK